MLTEEEKCNYCWKEFLEFCETEGISLEDEEDWKPWWECWKAGIVAANK